MARLRYQPRVLDSVKRPDGPRNEHIVVVRMSSVHMSYIAYMPYMFLKMLEIYVPRSTTF